MSYFGEEYTAENCQNCDNCLHPKERVEASENAVKVLKVIRALDERFATNYTVNIIIGKLTPQIQLFRHNGIAEFGLGKDESEYFWNSLIRQLLLEDLLKKDIEEYGVLKITKKGVAFLKKPTSFPIVLNNLFEEANEDDEEENGEISDAGATDEKLFELLKDLRQKEAKQKNLPPFVIFLENSLQDMATLYPTTAGELEKCQGVSKGKALRYGKPFIDLIAKYVIENDIERPDDFVMRSVVNKSVNKVYIIQQVDKKIALETIAKNKDMRLDALLEDMETIAASGTKLHLNYALDEMLDEYEQEEIIEYFKNCETSSLQVAQQELSGKNFSWEQLKLMRIKFLNEYGL
jgi:ATP-dependent DNA helicase RecQ